MDLTAQPASAGPRARSGAVRTTGPAALLALALGTGAVQPAMAQTPAATAAAADAPAEEEGVVDSARRNVRSTAEWLARGVDSWFGDRPFSEGGKVTDGRMTTSVLKRQGESVDFSLRFNARFRLPNLEKSSYLFFGRDDQRDVITDKPDAFTRQQRLLRENTADRAFFAGLGVAYRDSLDFRLGFRGGLKPYVQGRYRHLVPLSAANLIDFRQTVYWSVDDHIGSTTALSYEHAFTSTLAGRWLSAATITQRTKKFEWSSNLGAYQSFGDQRLLSLEALAFGTQGSGVALSDYGLQAKWLQPVYKDWLLGEVLVGHFWPRPDEFRPRGRAWAVGVSAKMKF